MTKFPTRFLQIALAAIALSLATASIKAQAVFADNLSGRYDQKLWTEGLGRKPKEQGLGSFLSDSVDKADAFD